jgi:hypothetical protein
MPPAGGPRDGLSRHGMRSLRRRSDAAFVHDGGRDAVITGLNYVLIVNLMGRSCPPNGMPFSGAPSEAERHVARNDVLKCH